MRGLPLVVVAEVADPAVGVDEGGDGCLPAGHARVGQVFPAVLAEAAAVVLADHRDLELTACTACLEALWVHGRSRSNRSGPRPGWPRGVALLDDRDLRHGGDRPRDDGGCRGPPRGFRHRSVRRSQPTRPAVCASPSTGWDPVAAHRVSLPPQRTPTSTCPSRLSGSRTPKPDKTSSGSPYPPQRRPRIQGLARADSRRPSAAHR